MVVARLTSVCRKAGSGHWCCTKAGHRKGGKWKRNTVRGWLYMIVLQILLHHTAAIPVTGSHTLAHARSGNHSSDAGQHNPRFERIHTSNGTLAASGLSVTVALVAHTKNATTKHTHIGGRQLLRMHQAVQWTRPGGGGSRRQNVALDLCDCDAWLCGNGF